MQFNQVRNFYLLWVCMDDSSKWESGNEIERPVELGTSLAGGGPLGIHRQGHSKCHSPLSFLGHTTWESKMYREILWLVNTVTKASNKE